MISLESRKLYTFSGKCYKCKENFKLAEVKIGRHGAFYHPLCIVPDDGSVQLRVSSKIFEREQTYEDP